MQGMVGSMQGMQGMFGSMQGMQGMFGASVSELYLLNKLLTVDLCVITKRNTHAYTGTVSQAWL